MKNKKLLKLLCVFFLSSCEFTSESTVSKDEKSITNSTEEVISEETTSLSVSEQTTSEDSNEISEEVSSSEQIISEDSSEPVDDAPAYIPPSPKVREDRIISTDPIYPTNLVDETKMIDAKPNYVYKDGNHFMMKSSKCDLKFKKDGETYYPVFIDKETYGELFTIAKPIKVFFKGQGQVESCYETISIKRYGLVCEGKVTSDKGSVIKVTDRYYYPDKEEVENAINIERSLEVLEANSGDKGFQSVFGLNTINSTTSNLEWFVPNELFGEITNISESQPYRIFSETLTGLPMGFIRDKNTKYSFSLARYQPTIEYHSNSYASVSVHKGLNSGGDNTSSVEITYPTRSAARRYFSVIANTQIVYDLTIMADKNDSFDEAMVNMYNNQFTLQDQRIVNTDIDEVYRTINEDFKSFMLTTERNGITSCGLPWRVTIENGKIGPKSYQAGFVGQQIPCAYHMMVYGLKYNDPESLQNGINIINFWVNSANMMSAAGVPKIWYDGGSNRWQGYPTFTRMAVDAMEGLLDAYRLAQAHNIETHNWYEAIQACADWFVKAQNNDGSWYRCYNYQGTYYQGNESDIPWNPGDICRSTSKNNSTMPVRFLGKMFELTNNIKYYNAITKAGDFIYSSLYPRHCYYGGTCDNPDALDKEAGVYAMYAYDTLYTLTGDQKYLKALEQATIFTMSSVLTLSYKINSAASDLKAANPVKYGYTDGLSYICCGGTSLDNYAAFIYYQLFRLYIYSGKRVYYDMAEFIQQNTKSTMDWDGTLDFAYRSLTPEASTIYSFGFSSAKDDDDIQGVWLPWQSDANAEPIAKMYEVFGSADVKTYENTSIEDLRRILNQFGIGGHSHTKYQ